MHYFYGSYKTTRLQFLSRGFRIFYKKKTVCMYHIHIYHYFDTPPSNIYSYIYIYTTLYNIRVPPLLPTSSSLIVVESKYV